VIPPSRQADGVVFPFGHFYLPKKAHNLFWSMLLSSCHSRLLLHQFLSLKLVQKSPGTPRVIYPMS